MYRNVGENQEASAWGEQALNGFRLGDHVISKETGELGTIQGIELHRVHVKYTGGTMSLLYPSQLEHREGIGDEIEPAAATTEAGTVGAATQAESE